MSKSVTEDVSEKHNPLGPLIVESLTLSGDLPVPDIAIQQERTQPRKALNSTAYRIFKLLQWLIHSPLSVDAMNRRFCEDPLIGKPVSNDSIWLYINTLRALGCEIRRPSPRNRFCYEMLSHPFGLNLSERHLESLSQAKAFAQQHFSHQEMRVLDGLLKKVVSYSACPDPQQTIEQMFSRSRSFDYDGLGHHIEAMEKWIAQGQLLWLAYLSPLKGAETFHFLPESIFYEQGVVYVRGERPECNGPSSLRVDRVLGMQPMVEPELNASLCERKKHQTTVLLHILAAGPSLFGGFGLNENHGVYEEDCQWVSTNASVYCEVRLQVRDFFYLKQRLLACGLPFQVLAPASFRKEVQATLQAMLELYQPVKEDLYGHC